jgi:hypothetical protein
MKRTFLLLTIILAMISPSFAADDTSMFDFKHASVSEVLSFYERLSGLKLVVDSRVGKITYFTTEECSGDKETQMIVIEATLASAGIIITRLHDNKRASVTFNDSLRLGGLIKTKGIIIQDSQGSGF